MMSENITKTTLAREVFYKMGIPLNLSHQILDSLFEEIVNSVLNDGVAKIPKFGSFYLKEKKQRLGRNPITKIEKIIPARKVVSFYPSDQLKQNLLKQESV